MSNNFNKPNSNQPAAAVKPIVEKLADKVSLVLKKHHELTGDNEVQRNEIAELKATLEAKNKEIEEKNKTIETLKEENEMKEMEIEEIVSKIENILG
jgi:chromosome segregation ATPase